MARKAGEPATQRLILDSGAIIALSRHEERARAFLQRALEVEAEVIVPVVVLAETLRGGPGDAPVHRVLNAVGDDNPTSRDVGRVAGRLLARADRDDTVDAMVVAEAVVRGGGRVLTNDPDDLDALAAGDRLVHVEHLQSSRKGSRRRRDQSR